MTRVGSFEISGIKAGMAFAGFSLASYLASKKLLNISSRANAGLSLSAGAIAAAVAGIRRKTQNPLFQSLLERARQLERIAPNHSYCVTEARKSLTSAGGPVVQYQVGRAVRERLQNTTSPAFYCELGEGGLSKYTNAELVSVSDPRFLATCSAVLDMAEKGNEITDAGPQRILLDQLTMVALYPGRVVSFDFSPITVGSALQLYPRNGDNALGSVDEFQQKLEESTRRCVIREADVLRWVSTPQKEFPANETA